MFKYSIVNFVYFVYVHQVIKSLEKTGILFHNNLYAFKLLIIMLCSVYISMMMHLYGETASLTEDGSKEVMVGDR